MVYIYIHIYDICIYILLTGGKKSNETAQGQERAFSLSPFQNALLTLYTIIVVKQLQIELA